MKRLLITTMLTGIFAVPAFAQDDLAEVSCAEFTALSALDAAALMEKLASVEGVVVANGATENIVAEDAAAGAGAEGEASVAADDPEDAGDNAVGASNNLAADAEAGAEAEAADGANPGAGAANAVTAEAIVEACTDDPDMTAQEAMEQVRGQ